MSLQTDEKSTTSELFLQEGEGYFKVVEGYSKRPEVFTAEIVHNCLCMSLEKYAMAILTHSRNLPDNHTFDDLVTALKFLIPVSAEVETALLALDDQSDLCSLDLRQAKVPELSEMGPIIEIGRRLRRGAFETVREGNPFTLALE
jgi:hypothetical protein